MVNLTDPKKLPYTGCYMVLITPNEKNHNGGGSDDGSCNTVLSADCIKDIITHVNNIAASYSGTFGGTNSTEFSCFDLMNGIIGDEKSKCWQQYGYFHDLFLPEYPGIIPAGKRHIIRSSLVPLLALGTCSTSTWTLFKRTTK